MNSGMNYESEIAIIVHVGWHSCPSDRCLAKDHLPPIMVICGFHAGSSLIGAIPYLAMAIY